LTGSKHLSSGNGNNKDVTSSERMKKGTSYSQTTAGFFDARANDEVRSPNRNAFIDVPESAAIDS